jgi:hypothetical protein
MRNRRKLKNFLISPKYQLKYVFWLTSSGLILTVVNSSIFYVYIKENYDTLVELLPMTDEVKNQLYSELHHIILILALVSLAFLIIVALLGIVLSHRTAGPMFHFKRVFREIGGGNCNSRVRLRPGDDWHDVMDEFNKMMDTISPKPPQ